MFTALNLEDQVLRGRRKIINERITCKKGEFYLSRLVSRKNDNTKYIEKFIKNCRVPVVLNTSDDVTEIKYRILLNTVIRYADKNTDIAIFDRQGKIQYLLAPAVENFRTVYVVSEEKSYETVCENLLAKYGTCAVLKDSLSDMGGCNHIISSERLPFSAGPYVFGEQGWFVKDCKPVFSCDFPGALPDYADVFSVAAGMYKYMGEQNVVKAYCTKFSLKGVKADAENFFK
ncbi:MAG: hypothetical protein KBS52_01225 [Clostridiales bacterium]|nr:hypothetical protein [Candidatus Equinaster intestinalis]